MFIRFHPQTFALKTMSVGALSVLTGNLVKNIFHQKSRGPARKRRQTENLTGGKKVESRMRKRNQKQ